MKQLDEPANQNLLGEDADELRATLATWQLEKPNDARPVTLTSPMLKPETIDIMVREFRELVKGFDEAEDMWGVDYTKFKIRRDVRKSVPAMRLKEELAECPQVRDYVDGLVKSGDVPPGERTEQCRFVAHNLMGSVIIQAILTAESIGIKIPRVEKGFF